MNLRNKTGITSILNRKSKIVNLKSQDGYVLVVIIGILTILSLMTITFATLSRIETRATRNYTDSVKCEMVAKAGLEHAIYELRLDKFGTDTLAYNNDNNNDENYDWTGDTSWPGNGIFDGTDYDNDGKFGSDSAWIYLPGTSTASSAIRLPGKLRARYAVLITDDREARININVTGNKAGGGSHTSNEGWSTFENDLSFVIEQAPGLNTTDGDNIVSDIIDTRLGSDNAPGTSAINDDTGIVPDPQTDNIDNDGDWITANDTNTNGIPDSGETDVDEADEATDEPNEFNSISPYGDDVPFGLLSEAEIMGTSSYESRLEGIFSTYTVSPEDQALLNNWLTTYSADTIVCPPYQLDGGTSTTKLNINALVNNEGVYTNTVTYDSDKKVEMIMDILVAGGTTGTAGSAGYVERHQTAVNIKDFIDSDSEVTTYLDVSSGDTYYGTDKTPYINEVEADVNVATSGGNGKFIELFNPYDTAISFSGNWLLQFGTNIISLSGTINARDYYVVADNAQAYETDFSYDGGFAADQYDLKINFLATGGEYITFKDQNGKTVQRTNYGSADNTTNTRQLNDPRPTPLMDADGTSNINASIPWRWRISVESAGGTNTATTAFDPSVGGDGWNSTTWSPSFIVANRRFSNKGYLGFIHNGRQWSSFLVDSTIVYPDIFQYFTVTDPCMDSIDNDGDGSTDSDDTGSQAGDFDGPEYRIPGLINVNTTPIEVLESLPNITNAIATAIQGDIQKPFSSIGNLLEDVPGITNTGTTKWDKEKPFRTISNLITTRSNVFTVYVTAQIINEAETSVFAEKKILAIVDRSVDPIKVRYFRWFTE